MKKQSEAHEGIVKYGAKAMSERQLLEILGVPEEAARELMTKTENSLSALYKMSIQDMTSIKGITTHKASAITAAIEIGRRRYSENAAQRNQITSSLDAYDILRPHMTDETQEVFYILLLDRRSKVLKMEHIHTGGMSAMVVDPKIVFQKALQYRACSIILSHNHPSGAVSPSIEDIRLTEKLKSAGSFLDIKVLDHVIIGEGGYYSFADEGKL